MRNWRELEEPARKIWGDALTALNFNHTRSTLQSELLKWARAYGLDRDEQLWCASRGLSWSGYGGGVG